MKEKLRVYHGLPKTPITDSTLYYSSFDGKTKSEVGTTDFTNSLDFYPMPTGYGLKIKTHEYLKINFEATTNITIDFWIDFDKWSYTENPSNTSLYEAILMGISKLADNITIRKYKSNQKIAFAYRGVEINLTNNSVAITGGIHHCRFVVLPNLVRFYLNGVVMKEVTSARDYSLCDSIQLFFTEHTSNRSYVTKVPISDFHISKGDLGDYFPTLPQDFIDGKAIVVPALNQRQSYGDPVLHQVTSLLVPAQLENEIGKYYSETDRDSDGYERCLVSPELTAGNWHNWAETYGKIRIKGLVDGECITGVFDTDTAKCRITKTVKSTKVVNVDTVEGIAVGDKLQYVYTNHLMGTNNFSYTVEAIDSANKTITMSHNTNWYEGDYFFEVTASSSSPVVKTVDGTVVNGTWSGLGTNVATFTFGTNSNIAGKDLYVTYCLNGEKNMSPYPKMPSEVIRGFNEYGIEQLPTSEILIKDDLKDKIANSTKECPHRLLYVNYASLQLPTASTWSEYTQDYYDSFPSIASPSVNHIAQVMIEIDLVALVENKFDFEIKGNKLDWLNKNISSIKCYVYARGENETNTNAHLKYFNDVEWISSGSSNTSSAYAEMTCNRVPTGNLNSTKAYFMVHSDALTQAVEDKKARVIVKNVRFEITLNTDPKYDYLYGKDTYSRGSKNNPIMIDKQTKEVKRFAPSRKPFATEVLAHSPKYFEKNLEDINLLCKLGNGYVSTHGSGSSCPLEDVYRGLIGKLGLSKLQPETFINSYIFSHSTTNALYPKSRIMKFDMQPYVSNFNEEGFNININENGLVMFPRLVEFDKELYLHMSMCKLKSDGSRDSSTISFVCYEIPNRPLIK